MKNRLTICAVALAAVCACSKQADALQPEGSGAKASLNVSVKGSSTKAAAETIGDEAKVGSLQVFVFKGDNLDVYGQASGTTSMTLSATVGARTVYAVLNGPDLSGVVSKSALEAAVSRLSDNAADNFVMVGSQDVTLSKTSNVSVSVDRIAARLRIKKITRKFSSAGLASLDASKFEITRVYVADAVTDNNYAVSKTSGFTWNNSTLGGSAISTSDAFLYKAPASPVTLAQNASSSEEYVFYVYPNPATEESASALFTRMIVECRIDGEYYTYPVIVEGGVQKNRSYEVNELIITRYGNPSNGDNTVDPGEDDKIESFDIPFGITINEWTLVLLGDAGTITI